MLDTVGVEDMIRVAAQLTSFGVIREFVNAYSTNLCLSCFFVRFVVLVVLEVFHRLGNDCLLRPSNDQFVLDYSWGDVLRVLSIFLYAICYAKGKYEIC